MSRAASRTRRREARGRIRPRRRGIGARRSVRSPARSRTRCPGPRPCPRRRALRRARRGSVLWFANLGSTRPDPSRRGRYAEIAREMAVTRRLADAAPERPQVFREAAAAILDDRRRLRGVRRARLDRAAVAGARRRFLASLFLGYRRLRAGRRRARRSTRALALARHAVACINGADLLTLDGGLAFFLTLAFGAFVIAQRAAATARRAPARGCGSPGRRWRARRCRRA